MPWLTKAQHFNQPMQKDAKSMWNDINKLRNHKSKTTNIDEIVTDQEVLT